MTTKMCSSYTGWSQHLNQTLKSNKIYTYIIYVKFTVKYQDIKHINVYKICMIQNIVLSQSQLLPSSMKTNHIFDKLLTNHMTNHMTNKQTNKQTLGLYGNTNAPQCRTIMLENWLHLAAKPTTNLQSERQHWQGIDTEQ